MTTERRPLPKLVWKLGWVSFFADICSEMVYPIIPLFVVGVLKAPAWVLGLSEGVAESTASILKGWSGLHSDKRGRRAPYIQTGYGLSAIGKPLLGLAFAWPVVLLGRAVDRVGKGLRTTARDAMIADETPKDQYGAAFGVHRAMDTAGAWVGVMLVWVLVQFFVIDFRAIFIGAVIPGAIAFALTLTIRDRKRDAPPEGTKIKLSEVAKQLPKPFWTAFWVSMVFALASSSDTFLMLRASGQGLGSGTVVLIYAAYNVVVMIFSYPAGWLSDRIGRWWLLALGTIVYGICYWGFGSLWVSLWALFAVYGIAIGLTQGVTKALVADHSPKNLKGSAMGIFYFSTGIVVLLSNLLTGYLYDHASPRIAFFTCAAFAGVAGVAAVALALGEKKQVKPELA